ncbi:MAG TPA: hypothetical protein DFR83_15560, partial [Deltaproteobacteria bacterium]|nr:hypothetical protein [Deltaproteobacteria bacterium]
EGEGEGEGVVDEFTAAVCDLWAQEPTALAMGASQREANTAVILPDEETAWLLGMPATGDGWFTIEVPDWMTIVHLSTQQGVVIEVQGGESFSEQTANGSCPDAAITDQRWAFHEWGAYQVRVVEGAPSEVWFALVKE